MNKTTSLQRNYGLGWYTINEKCNAVIAELKDKWISSQGTFNIRQIKPKESFSTKEFIQKTLIEKGGIGFHKLYYDAELIDLYDSFNEKGAGFWLLMNKDQIVGTIGLRTDPNTRIGVISKLYLKNEASAHAVSLLKVAQSFAKRHGAVF